MIYLEFFAEVLTNLHCTSDAILMETIAPVGTGEMGAINPADLIVALPGGQAFGVVDRMVIDILPMDFVRVYGFGQIERNAKFLGRPDAL